MDNDALHLDARLGIGVGIRWFREEVRLILWPLHWVPGLWTSSDTSKDRSRADIRCGPLGATAFSYGKHTRFLGPAISVFIECRDVVAEIRIVPLLWRWRMKNGFVSIGPVKLILMPSVGGRREF